MNRREAVTALGALALGACINPNDTEPIVRDTPLFRSVHVHCGFQSPRSEWKKVPGTQCPFQYPWDEMKTPDRIPALGKYDEAERYVTVQRCEWMSQSFINAAIYQIDTDYRALRLAA